MYTHNHLVILPCSCTQYTPYSQVKLRAVPRMVPPGRLGLEIDGEIPFRFICCVLPHRPSPGVAGRFFTVGASKSVISSVWGICWSRRFRRGAWLVQRPSFRPQGYAPRVGGWVGKQNTPHRACRLGGCCSQYWRSIIRFC